MGKSILLIKRALLSVLQSDFELNKILTLVADLKRNKANFKILDVACGYGRILKPLTEMGYEVTGVEINEKIVLQNRQKSLPCLTPSELEKKAEVYDVLIMSHVIEHFAPSDLLKFMDFYLDKLRGGPLNHSDTSLH